MKKIGNLLLPMLWWTIFTLSYWAQAQEGIVVDAITDRERLEVGDTFTVTVTIQSQESVQADDPDVPSLTGLVLVQQWQNTAIQQSLTQTPKGMDWQTIRKHQFHYMFQANREGRYSVDAFEVVVNGKLFRTRPLVVEVLPQGQAPRKVPQGRRRPVFPGLDEDEERLLQEQEEIFNQLLQPRVRPRALGVPGAIGGSEKAEPEFRSMPTNLNEAFFVQVEVDKRSVYEGEQVTASWYLLTRGQIETLDRVKFPNLKGFWKEIIEENPQIQFSEEIINGVVFRKALLASHALFPIRSGKTAIDEFTVKSRVRLPSQGLGFGFGFGRPYEYTRNSKRVEIDVKPLPLDGRPAHFTGAVGNFDVNSQVEATRISAHQPFSLKVRFEGQGNAKAIELPKISWPEGLEMYDSKNESRFFKDGRSYKEYEILLIPRKPGSLEIPGIEFAFFNPKTGKYEGKTTQAIRLEVAEGAPTPSTLGENFLGEKKIETKKVLSLPPLVTSPSQIRSVSAVSGALVWNGVLAFSLFSLVAYGAFVLRPQSRGVSLRKHLDQQWKRVELAQGKNLSRQVGAEIVNAFNLIMAELTSHRGEILEVDRMLEKLTPDKRNRHASSVKECYEKAEQLGFAPDAVVESLVQSGQLEALVKKSKQVLQQLCGE